MKRIYMDHAATTPARPEVAEIMNLYLTDAFGNPSSAYSYGAESREAVADARLKVARLIGANPDEILFTSGGTESDNHAIVGTISANIKKGNHVITTTIEHHAVLDTCRFMQKDGIDITFLPVDSCGMVDPDDVKKAITGRTVLISIMHANNEVGTIEPIAEIGSIARDAGVCLHTDAVQTAGHIPIDVNELGVDLLSISAHKLYGPKGTGALYIRRGVKIDKLLHGGEQERNRRAGTENVPGIVGFGVAAEKALEELHTEAERQTKLRDRLIEGIDKNIKNTSLNGHRQNRLPNNVNMCLDYVEGESVLLNLDLEGICASSGSACTASSLDPSHVLLALGLPANKARSAIRFSLGRMNSEDDIDRVIDTLPRVVTRLRSLSPLIK